MPDSREVFALRKQGRFEDALDLAREVIQEDPNNPWNIKALGWALHSCIKSALENNDNQNAATLFRELQALRIPDDDEVLIRQREVLAHRADPRFGTLRRARAASDAGNREEALTLYRQAVRQFPDVAEAQTGLGWEIERKLKDLCAAEQVNAEPIVQLLREYGRLNLVEKPGRLHSLVLAQATRVADKLPNYLEFVRWWNLAHLTPEDYERYKPKDSDKEYPSLAEKLMRNLYQAVKRNRELEDIAWIADFFSQHHQRFPDNKWPPYWYGRILIRMGRLDDARKLVLPVVQRQQAASWAWHVLADTFAQSDPQKRRACLAQALLCTAQEDQFLVGVRQAFAQDLKEDGHLAAAKHEIEQIIQIRTKEEWKIGNDLLQEQRSDWFQQTEASKDNTDLYRQYSAAASEILTEGLPWINAIVTWHQEAKDDKPGRTFVGVNTKTGVVEIPVKHGKQPQIAAIDKGAPIKVKIQMDGDHPVIVTFAQRDDGNPWDLYKEMPGVISSIRSNEHSSFVTLSAEHSVRLKHEEFREAEGWAIGSTVRVRIRVRKKEDRQFIDVLTARRTDEPPPDGICKPFHGPFRQKEGQGFGFADDVFVPPYLVAEAGITAECQVEGVAIRDWDKSKNRASWRAMKISAV